MKTPNHLQLIALGALLALSTLHAPTALAQRSHSYENDRVRVLDRGRGFLVSVSDDPGTSPEHAGLKAMEWACRISLERGFTHMGVEDFRTGASSGDIQTSEARTEYAQDINGRYVESGTRPAQVNTLVWGTAVLGVVMMTEGVANNLSDTLQIINANSCTIVN